MESTRKRKESNKVKRKREKFLRNFFFGLYFSDKKTHEKSLGTFKGQELIRWLHHDPVYGENEMEVAQGLMNFNFIAPVTAFDSYTLETFDPAKLYQFKVSRDKN